MAGHGTFYWNELVTTDPDKAKAFYGDVLGWAYREMNMENPTEPAQPGGRTYSICQADETMAGGIMKMDGPQWDGVPPHWVSYIRVDDVDATVAKVEPAGGTVKAAPFDIPSVGRMAVIADPTGAEVCLMTPADGGGEAG